MRLPDMEAETDREEENLYRREAIGAFAHEVRTPLTSIKMVLELARRQSEDGQLVLDAELADMLRTSVDDLQRLADELQETSRLERGRARLSYGPSDLGAALEAAAELARPLALEFRGEAHFEGPWDGTALSRAIAGFAESANRVGDGSGAVRVEVSSGDGFATLALSSGLPSGESRSIAADAGFSFFKSRQLVLAMGGFVHFVRADRFATISVALPLRREGEDR